MIARLFRHMFTGTDNQSFELGRVMWALTVLSAIVYQGVALAFKNQEFDVTDFGTGMGIILAAGGVGVAVKDIANPMNRKANVKVSSAEEVNIDARGGSAPDGTAGTFS